MFTMKLIPIVFLCINTVKSSGDLHSLDQNTNIGHKDETTKPEIFISVPVPVVYEEGERNNKTSSTSNNNTASDEQLDINILSKETLSENKLPSNFNFNDDKEDNSTFIIQNVEKVNQETLPIKDNKTDNKTLVSLKESINSGQNSKDGKNTDEDMKQNSYSDMVSDIPVVVIYDPLPEYLQNHDKVITIENKHTIQMLDKTTNKADIKEKPQNLNEKQDFKSTKVNGSKIEQKLIDNSSNIENTTNRKTTSRSRTQSKNPTNPEDVQNQRQQRRQNYKVKDNNLNESQDIKSQLHTKVENESTENVAKMNSKFKKRTRERDPIIPIIQSESYVYSDRGDFHYSYESGDGTKAFERGQLRTIDDNAGESVVGSFSYIGKDGNDYSLTYTADENGYRPVGAHLPTPPPIPIAIARALKYLATKTTPGPVTEPSY